MQVRWESLYTMIICIYMLKQNSMLTNALGTGMRKINEYYEHSAESNAHLVAMVLIPNKKLLHFRDTWDYQAVQDAIKTLQNVFVEQYNSLNKDSLAVQGKSKAKAKAFSV
ncbi:hypothetical protein CVT24_010181 [Panaeolus cyanescens]|uniref:hAT-like transposase RNase-H fold domain-containing protein n=1 Tax=Panaeolus cyanescens TaxID=181874 RepID=A0A409X2Q9_9AGAR|nr:hypothetical protein CVT24_010181 [Panaeolus cyanescens]